MDIVKTSNRLRTHVMDAHNGSTPPFFLNLTILIGYMKSFGISGGILCGPIGLAFSFIGSGVDRENR
jgi:hypothetical protein